MTPAIAPVLALTLLLMAAPAVHGEAAGSLSFETARPAPGFLPRATPESVGLEAGRVEAFVESARLANSDALVVLKNGKVIVERTFEQQTTPVPCMAITRAVASLAIGKLLDEGKIRSLEEPLATWFPEWRQDPRKARITLRQVLTHTSGLPRLTSGERYRHDDMLAFARSLAVESEPGDRWEDSDAGAMLIAGIVQAASGERIDAYMQTKLFLPMGIVDWTWHRDKADNPDTFGGLALHPRDLAKIGQLMLDQGRWQGKQLLSIRYVTEAIAPSQALYPHQALGWQVLYPDGFLMQTPEGLAALEKAGFGATAKLEALNGRRFPFGMGYMDEAQQRLTSLEFARLRTLMRRAIGPVTAQYGRRFFGQDGWPGQYLVVDPTTRLVAVRLIRDKRPDSENPRDTFDSFYDHFGRLAGL